MSAFFPFYETNSDRNRVVLCLSPRLATSSTMASTLGVLILDPLIHVEIVRWTSNETCGCVWNIKQEKQAQYESFRHEFWFSLGNLEPKARGVTW